VSAVELVDSEGLLPRVRQPGADLGQVRADVDRLAGMLAAGTAAHLSRAGHRLDDVLCVVILRGGALLYPAFQSAMRLAAFQFVAAQRQPAGDVEISYRSEVPHRDYAAVIYLDAIAATGRTITAAANADRYGNASAYCALLCASQQATRYLNGRGCQVVGFALGERLDGDLVSPDLGDLDAGDLMADPQQFRTGPSTAPAGLLAIG